MLNIYHYNRFANGTVLLASALNYYDTTITVDNATELSNPIQNRNIPGIIYIAGERIEYMSKVGNVLSQLRRGVQGTAIGELYTIGTKVVDIGYQEIIPYNETQERIDFVSNGTPDDSTAGAAQTIGPLDYTPVKSTRNNWSRNTIPAEYGPCDTIEIFVAGRRLRKDPIDVWIEENGASSPEADITQEAEFSVDGITNSIRLTTTVPAGSRITIIRKVGKTWYDRGETTASNGVTLLDNETAIAKFIAQKTTSLPE
jgi:hypothetical protein